MNYNSKINCFMINKIKKEFIKIFHKIYNIVSQSKKKLTRKKQNSKFNR